MKIIPFCSLIYAQDNSGHKNWPIQKFQKYPSSVLKQKPLMEKIHISFGEVKKLK